MFNYFLFALFFLVTSCSNSDDSGRDGAPSTKVHAINAPNPIPRIEKKSRYGNSRTYTVKGKKYHVLPTAKNYHKIGIASWYGTKFHGRLTSSREPYNMFALTAASKELPIPCYVQVRNLANNKKVIVRVNDRGPFKPGRIMDLSYAAAQKIDMLKKGTARVEIKYLQGKVKVKNNKHYLSSLSLGLFRDKKYAQMLRKKINQFKVLSKNSLIKKDEFYQLIIGPIPKNKLSIARKTLKKLHLSSKII